jgi:mannose-1-phosphate guanylyltransferase
MPSELTAVILAGGAGTRLRPLTYARRKELVPVLNRPLLEYRLRNLREHGVTQVVLACARGVREIEAAFGDGGDIGIALAYHYEDRPLGSGRAVKDAARAAGASGTIVVCNGDILTNVDLSSMLEQHAATGATLSISLAPVEDPWHYGVVEVDEDLRVRSFVEKPPQGEQPSDLINAGTWLFEPEVLARVPDDESAVVDGFSERVLFPGIIADGLRVQGFVEDLWVDVGSPERYLRANRLMLERVAEQLGEDVISLEGSTIADDAKLSGLVYVGRGAAIGPSARITGPVIIGDRASIGEGAVVESSVLWEQVAVGESARVSGSIAGGRVSIELAATVTDAVLADGASVAAAHQLPAGAMLMPDDRAGG